MPSWLTQLALFLVEKFGIPFALWILTKRFPNFGPALGRLIKDIEAAMGDTQLEMKAAAHLAAFSPPMGK